MQYSLVLILSSSLLGYTAANNHTYHYRKHVHGHHGHQGHNLSSLSNSTRHNNFTSSLNHTSTVPIAPVQSSYRPSITPSAKLPAKQDATGKVPEDEEPDCEDQEPETSAAAQLYSSTPAAQYHVPDVTSVVSSTTTCEPVTSYYPVTVYVTVPQKQSTTTIDSSSVASSNALSTAVSASSQDQNTQVYTTAEHTSTATRPQITTPAVRDVASDSQSQPYISTTRVTSTRTVCLCESATATATSSNAVPTKPITTPYTNSTIANSPLNSTCTTKECLEKKHPHREHRLHRHHKHHKHRDQYGDKDGVQHHKPHHHSHVLTGFKNGTKPSSDQAS